MLVLEAHRTCNTCDPLIIFNINKLKYETLQKEATYDK